MDALAAKFSFDVLMDDDAVPAEAEIARTLENPSALVCKTQTDEIAAERRASLFV